MILNYARNLLSSPSLYMASQSAMGAVHARKWCVRELISQREGLRVLDLGCGTGYVASYFKSAEYIGVDINQRYIDYAGKKYGKYGRFLCKEITLETVKEFKPFDLVMMNGLLHHLTDAEGFSFLSVAKNALKPNGKMVTLDGCFDKNQSPIAKKLLISDRGEFVRTQKEYTDLAKKVFSRVNPHLRHDLLYVPYSILMMECFI